MIEAVAFVPQAPLLVPAMTGGTSPELDELRAACRAAVQAVTLPGRRLVLVGAGPSGASFASNARGDMTGHGVDLEIGLGSDASGRIELPTALTVGAWLVRDAVGPGSGAIAYSVAPDEPGLPTDLATSDERIALIVLGDGTACRTLKAPRYLDERAAGYDTFIARALHDGRGELLRRSLHDEALLDQLHVAGLSVWNEIARLTEAQSPWNAELTYDAAPFGVGYFVATWAARA